MKGVDLTVVGGGIVGLGVARAAVRRGLTVLICDQGPLAVETSAHSHCIIHSGVRYLQHGAIARVLASARSLAELRASYPDEVVPLSCWMPLRRGGLRGSMALRAGHLLYRTVLAARGLTVSQWPGVVGADQVPDHPLLRGRCGEGAFGWEDGWLCDHQALVRKLRHEIETGGGLVREQTPVKGVQRDGRDFLVETLNGELIRSAAVIDARGPSIRQSLTANESPEGKGPASNWCVGFNVTLSIDLSEGCGIAVATSGGRLLFVAPRRGAGQAQSAIGTGYLAFEDGEVPVVREEHAASLVSAVAHATGVNVSVADIVGIESGILPRSAGSSSEVTADPATYLIERGGYLVVQSGKYTTFPVVGEEVISAVQGRIERRREEGN